MRAAARGLTALVLLLWAGAAAAATRTWDGGGADNNWSTVNNWSDNTAPVAGDSVVFDGTSTKNCTMDTDVDLADFSVNAGYTGTISKTGTRRITLGYGANSGGVFTQAAGTFQAPDNFLVSRINRSGGTFTHNSGTVLLHDPDADRSNTFNNATFYDLVINDGMIGYWKFDETSVGTVTDYSGFDRDLTVVNSATVSTSLPSVLFYDSRSLTFAKSSSQYARTGTLTPTSTTSNSAILRPTSWTISAWVKLTSLDTSGGEVLSGGNSYALRLVTGVKARVIMRNAAAAWDICESSNSFTANDGNWHHVVAVNDAGTISVWLDGTETISGNNQCGATGNTQSYASTDDDLRVGAHTSSANFDLDGSVDEVRLYNRALTDTEILALYSGSTPGTALRTQTAGDGFSVANNVVIGAGRFDDGGQSFTVTGSFFNYGGLMTATGHLTMNTAGTEYIQGNRQFFNNFTMSGTGTVRIRDSLYVAGTVNLSSGILIHEANNARYKGHFGTFNQTGGTYDQNSLGGTNVISSSASNTFKVTSTVSQFRFEARGENGLVGYWKLDDQTGNTAFDTSMTGNAGTLMGGVRWWNQLFNHGGTTSAIGQPIGFFYDGGWVDLDGTDDYITLGTTSLPVPNASQSISLWVYYDATTAAQQNFYSLVDTTAANNIQLGFHNSNIAAWKAGGTDLVTYAIPAASAWHHVVYTYDSTTATHKLYVDGTLQDTETGIAADGAGSAPYYATIGAYRSNGGSYAQFFDGKIDDVRVYNVVLTARQVKSMSQDKYPGLGSSVTWTLGANMSTGSFAMDNGTLATSTYTVTASGNCYMPSGTFKIDVGGVANCSNNPIVYDTGTLNLAGGTMNVASTRVIEMDGTLIAATTSGTTPTIQSISGTYSFHVGQANSNDSSSPTPTLNINGLNVKNTDADGLYINYNTASSTTVRRFDNINFSSGNTTSGSTLVRIYGTSQYVTGNGCTFDRTGMNATSYNVKIAGNGTADGETRATFGNTTCKNTAGAAETCESNDSDNDSGNDGVGDTTATDAGVVQFVKQAYSESQGSIAGFPTPAFNWNTFAYWRTYAAFNNDDGAGTNTLYGRDDSGSSASYTWSIPAGYGTFVGAPRWDMESATHYVYIVTSLGYVYKLTDDGSSFAVAAGYPYRNSTGGNAATATSPLVMDATSLYWAGLDGGGSRKMFRVTRSSGALNGTPRALSADINGGLAISSHSGTNYLFGATNLIASNGKVYKLSLDLATEYGSSAGQQSTTNISGRLTTYNQVIYFAEDSGKIWAIDTSDDLATVWSYQDTGSGHGACSASSTCTVKALYLEPTSKRVYYGDQDGHLYVVSRNGSTSSGVLYSGYPVRPTGNSTSDPFTSAPVFVNGLGGTNAGVIAAGTSTGKLFFVDQQNASSAPALIRMFHYGSAVSAISFRRTSSSAGVFNVSTADGHTYYIDSADVADPTPNNN